MHPCQIYDGTHTLVSNRVLRPPRPVGIALILYFAMCPLLSLNQLPLPLTPADGRLFCPVAPRQ